MHFDDFLMTADRAPPDTDFTPFFNSEVKANTSTKFIIRVVSVFSCIIMHPHGGNVR